MLDLDKLRAEGDALLKSFSAAAGMQITPELAVKLYEAALGKTGMELHRLTVAFGNEADKCRVAEAWFAACLMTASAIEGLLALFCILAQEEVKMSKAFAGLSKGDSYEDKISNASFDKLIRSHLSEAGYHPTLLTCNYLERHLQIFLS